MKEKTMIGELVHLCPVLLFGLVVSLLVALLTSCTQTAKIKEERDKVLISAVSDYCQLPESVRMANRERFKMSPDKAPFVQIFCENL